MIKFIAITLLLLASTYAETLTKKAHFSAAKSTEASGTRILLKSFLSPSELACSQKCLRHDECNFKKYTPATKKCELLRQISKDDISIGVMVTKKESFYHNRHSLCKPILSTGCGENCNCEIVTSQYRCSCIQKGLFKSCKEALESNDFQTAIYRILPSDFANPIDVECMKDEHGETFAVVHHNDEKATSVKGYEPHGSYRFNFTYSLDINTIISLINQSSHCQQYTKLRCHHSFFYREEFELKWNTWVHGRNGQKLDFWGGGPSNGTGCACGITGNCAYGNKCNCDANDSEWRLDEGNIVKKEVLPITAMVTGDTGDPEVNEEMIYTIGPLLCVS